MGAARIQDYGVIGDGRSAALVSRGGSIDWLCWPRFDSPSLFAGLLDPEHGGHFRIAPAAPLRVQRAYARDSNVLVTEFETAAGSLRLTDFMPVCDENEKRRLTVPEHEIVRVAECLRGEVDVEVSFAPRPGYGRKWYRSDQPAAWVFESKTAGACSRFAPIATSKPVTPPRPAFAYGPASARTFR